jgi:mannose-6-phosphate isomerase-like protein (cupin superfamily)
VLAGGGVMVVDGEEVELRPGRYVFVAPESVRQPFAGPTGLSWVVVGAPPQDGWEPQL